MNWMPHISTWILENILQDMILRRIQHHVEEWNPLTDRVPIHSWIYPWIAFLGTCCQPYSHVFVSLPRGKLF